MAKKNDRWDAIAASSPLDSTAAKVTARGTHYEPEIGFGSQAHWDAPPPIKPYRHNPQCQDLTGLKFGRFTVIGLHDSKRGSHAKGPATWICKCVCGDYESRTKKAITNPKNTQDACKKCRDWLYKQRRYEQLGSRSITDFTSS